MNVISHLLIEFLGQPSERVRQETAALRRDRASEEQKLEEHRREIERLEREMQHLWGPHYAPPVRQLHALKWARLTLRKQAIMFEKILAVTTACIIHRS